MIRIFNSALEGERFIPLNEVNVHVQKIDEFTGAPYIIFEHTDFPLGGIVAQYDGTYWQADMNQKETLFLIRLCRGVDQLKALSLREYIRL